MEPQEIIINDEQYQELILFREDLQDLKTYKNWDIGLNTFIIVLLVFILISVYLSKLSLR